MGVAGLQQGRPHYPRNSVAPASSVRQWAAAATASQIWSTQRETSAASEASTITRSTGSVPEGLSSTRPADPSDCSARAFASTMAGALSQSNPLGTFTF